MAISPRRASSRRSKGSAFMAAAGGQSPGGHSPGGHLHETSPDAVGAEIEKRGSLQFQNIAEVEMHHDYWHENTTHVVGVSMEIHYVNNINTVEQTFVSGFHLTLEWQPSEAEVISYKKALKAHHENPADNHLVDWEPDFTPHIRFPNCLEFQQKEWETHLDGSTITLLTRGERDTRGAIVEMELQYLLSATLNVRAKFGEPFELENFPFDVQDLKIMFASCATAERQILVPHFEKNAFIKINMDVSCLPDWDFDRAVAEFDLSDPNTNLYKIQFSTCCVNLKVVRRFTSYVERVMAMMCIICATMFTLFALDAAEDAGDRLSNAFGLLLAGLVFMFVVSSSLPNVPYLTILDKYIYSVFIFMLLIAIECAVVKQFDDPHKVDALCFKGFVATYVLLHVVFMIISFFARRYELKKLHWTSEDYEKEHENDKSAPPKSMTIESDNIREPHHNYWSHGDHVAKTHSHHIEHMQSAQNLSVTAMMDHQKHELDDVKTPPTEVKTTNLDPEPRDSEVATPFVVEPDKKKQVEMSSPL